MDHLIGIHEDEKGNSKQHSLVALKELKDYLNLFSDEEVCELEDYFNTSVTGINCDKVGSDLFGEEDLEAFA